jgi:purine-binding chemotaxis protein CheW
MDITSLLTEKCTGLVIFEISGLEYCLNNTIISSISALETDHQFDPSGNTKYSMFRVNNTMIPLIDLKKILLGEQLKMDENSRIVIIEYEDISVGLLVTKIKEIIAVDMDFMSTAMKFIPDTKRRYIEGIIEFEDRKFLFLNIEKMVTDIGCI